MCSISAAMIGLTALQGYGQYQSTRQQYRAQAAAYDAQAQAAEQNAKIADRQRDQVADQYAQRQQQLNDKRRLILGQQAASAGASGLMGTGSVLDANAAAIGQWRDDSMNLLSNQRNDSLSAWANQVNYMNQASQARAAAANTRAQAKAAKTATILGTAASMYGAYKTYGNPFQSSAKSAGTMTARTGFSGDLMSGTLKYDTPTALYQKASPSLFLSGKTAVRNTIGSSPFTKWKYPWER